MYFYNFLEEHKINVKIDKGRYMKMAPMKKINVSDTHPKTRLSLTLK